MIIVWNNTRASNPYQICEQDYTWNGPTSDFFKKESASVNTFYTLSSGDKVKIVARVIVGNAVETAAKTVRLRITEAPID